MKFDLLPPREQIVTIMKRIYGYSMTTTSGGNLSLLDSNGDVWITPAGIDKGALTPEDIVCVKADGTVEGTHSPSSEYPFHRAIYAMRPDFRAIFRVDNLLDEEYAVARRPAGLRPGRSRTAFIGFTWDI